MRGYRTRSAAVLAVAFLLVLAVPDHDRALGLYALSGLVIALAQVPLADERRLTGLTATRHSPPSELAALTTGTRAALRERTLDEHVYETIRTVVSVRLARNHGIELERDPAGARRVLGDGLLWQFLETPRAWGRLRVGGGELEQIVDQLERL
jgi:hypothetical protein